MTARVKSQSYSWDLWCKEYGSKNSDNFLELQGKQWIQERAITLHTGKKKKKTKN